MTHFMRFVATGSGSGCSKWTLRVPWSRDRWGDVMGRRTRSTMSRSWAVGDFLACWKMNGALWSRRIG